jgi:hypothetical protein
MIGRIKLSLVTVLVVGLQALDAVIVVLLLFALVPPSEAFLLADGAGSLVDAPLSCFSLIALAVQHLCW